MLHFLRQKQTLISELLTQMCARVRVCAPALPVRGQTDATDSLGEVCVLEQCLNEQNKVTMYLQAKCLGTSLHHEPALEFAFLDGVLALRQADADFFT